MLESRLQRLEQDLVRNPADRGALRELAREAARLSVLPPFLRPQEHLPGLLSLWREHPRDRSPGALVLPLLGLEGIREGRAPGRFWDQSGRRVVSDGEEHDAQTGLPLRARRLRDGAVLALVPEGEFLQGLDLDPAGIAERVLERSTAHAGDPPGLDVLDRVTHPSGAAAGPHSELLIPACRDCDQPGWFWIQSDLVRPALPARRRWLASFYIDVEAMPVSRYRHAEELARRAGARLATPAEWEKAARGCEGELYPWGDRAPAELEGLELPTPPRSVDDHSWQRFARASQACLAELAAHPDLVSPFGLRAAVGELPQWCAGRVLKGGSWVWHPVQCWYGLTDAPSGPDTGTRLVVPVEPGVGDDVAGGPGRMGRS